MSQHALDVDDAGAALEQVSGKGVPQGMGSQPHCDSGPAGAVPDGSFDRGRLNPAALRPEEQGQSVPAPAITRRIPGTSQVVPHGGPGSVSQRNDPVLPSFAAQDPNETAAEVDIVDVQTTQFGDPDPR